MNYKKVIHSSVAKQTIIYTATDAIAKGINFLVLPFISYFMAPDQLGIAANFDVLQSIVMLLSGLVVVNGLPYFFYDRDKSSFSLFVSNLIFLFVFVSLFWGIVFLFISNIVTNNLQLSLAMQMMIVIAVISQMLIAVNTVIYRLEENPLMFGVIHIIQVVLVILLLFYFVCFCKLEAMGKILSTVVALAIIAVLNFLLLFRRGYFVLKIHKKSLTEILHFGLPLLPHSLSFWLKSGADKILITTFCGLTYNGLYSMALSFGGFYSIATTAFNNAYVPYLQKRISQINDKNEIDEKLKIVKMTYSLMGAFVLLSIVVIVLCYFLIKYMLDDRYIGTFFFIPWIIFSLTINTMYTFVIQFPYTIKKTNGLGLITFIGSLIQLLMTYILINYEGISGVNHSLFIGSLLIMFSVWWYSQKVYPMPWFSRPRKNSRNYR